MSAVTQNEMEWLRKERDEHEQARTALEEELGRVILERDEDFARGKQAFDDLRRVEADRDALAAHVERLTGLLREHHEDFMSDGSADWDESDWDGRVAHALEDTPETSLTHLKAQWQADAPEEEAREWPADKYTECSHVRESILDSAAQLRQKSEAYK